MRVGIDLRILSVGRSWINRGMVRYTQTQLREVLAQDVENDYLLFCRHDADLELILPEIRRAANVSILTIPQSLANAPSDDENVLSVGEAFESWISEHDLDVYHATTPFYDEVQPFLPSFDACPLVTTLYDLIPLIYPKEYLHDPVKRRNYQLALHLLKGSTRILAISNACRLDALRFLGLDVARIDVAWPIADPCFRPMSRGIAHLHLSGLASRGAIPDRFILLVTARHHAKNLDNTIAAYATLPSELRSCLPLMLGGHLGDRDPGLTHRLGELGIQGNVIFTGLLSEFELAALYNLATFVVHASAYEGFGLPVLEAMQCGTPVITSTTSSLPELAGEAAIMVQPHDVAGLAAAMATVADDAALRSRLSASGLARANQFSAAQLAAVTLRSYLRAADQRPIPASKRVRLAVWSPVPPHQSGVADFTVELIDHLSPHVDLELFVDGGVLPATRLMMHNQIRHFSSFGRRHGALPFDAVLYEFGASYFHRYMYEPLQDHPGIVDLHDLSWNRVLYHAAVTSGDLELFERPLQALEGETALLEFKTIPSVGTADLLDPALVAFLDAHLMLNRIIARSLAQVVHFPAAKLLLESRYPDARTYVIPMGVADPFLERPPPNRALTRLRLGLSPSAFVIGVFGIVDPVKRVDTVIRALAQVVRLRSDAHILVVGLVLQDSYQAQLCRLAEDLGIADRIRFTGRIPRSAFDAHLVACDVVVNLRYATQRQMSAIILRAAAAGKPVVASDIPDWSFVPHDFCSRVPLDGSETASLVRQLGRWATDPALLADASSKARQFYLREATLELMASRYLALIDEVRLMSSGAHDGHRRAILHTPQAPVKAAR